MPSIEDLIAVKFGLECIGIKNSILSRVGGSTCDDIEKLCIMKTNEGYKVYGTFDLFLAGELNKPLFPPEEFIRMFGSDEYAREKVPTPDLRRELWYHLDKGIVAGEVVALGDTEETLDTFAILEGGSWVARAWSVRRNDVSAEVAVETKETHRRRGLGSKVVLAWAFHQILKGKTPIYAHRKYNLESKYLAEKIGCILFADVLSFQ